MVTLAELIMQLKGDESFDRFARRTGLSGTTIHKFATGRNTEFPPPETINKLADALKVSPARIIMAAAYGLGFDMQQTVTGPRLGEKLPSRVDSLPQRAQRSIVDMAVALVDVMDGPSQTSEATNDGGPVQPPLREVRGRGARAAARVRNHGD